MEATSQISIPLCPLLSPDKHPRDDTCPAEMTSAPEIDPRVLAAAPRMKAKQEKQLFLFCLLWAEELFSSLSAGQFASHGENR